MSLEDTFPITFNTEYDLKKFINDAITYIKKYQKELEKKNIPVPDDVK